MERFVFTMYLQYNNRLKMKIINYNYFNFNYKNSENFFEIIVYE